MTDKKIVKTFKESSIAKLILGAIVTIITAWIAQDAAKYGHTLPGCHQKPVVHEKIEIETLQGIGK